MSQAKLKTAYVLSSIIAILMLVQSLGGLFLQGLYRDNTFVQSGWYGNDLVTLVVAVPLLIGALIFSIRGSSQAQLLWLGMLDYTLYNYAFYLFGAAFNSFFLIYLALFTLAIYALVFALVNIDVVAISQQFQARTPIQWISGYMVLWAVILGGLWISESLNFIFTNQLPGIVVATAHPTNVVAILDLSLMVPAVFLGAIWLWKRQPWGYVLAAIMNVKGAVFALVLAVGSYVGTTNGISGLTEQIPIWVFLSTASLLCCGFLLGNMKSTEEGTKLNRSSSEQQV
jgi:hypothetical protein